MFGSIVAISASVLPSLLLMIFLAAVLYKLKGTNKFSMLTLLIRPVIAILLGVIVFDFLFSSLEVSGTFHTVFLIGLSFVLLQIVKIHPALVIVIGLIYGAVFIR